MTPADRFRKWIEELSEAWKERLSGWVATAAMKGLDLFADLLGKGLAKQMPELITKLKDASAETPELKALIERAEQGGGQWQALLLGVTAGTALGGGISSALLPGLEKLKQLMSKKDPFQLLPLPTLLTLWYRKLLPDIVLNDELAKLGFNPDHIKYLKDSFLFFPLVSDIIRFAVREVYTPEIAEKFGQFEDFPDKALPDAAKIGITPEVLKSYWAAHWELPSPLQGFEMLHRGVIDEETLKMLLRALDVMPYWRDKLIDISWNVPTRVDIRRFFEMGVINEERLRELYTAFGYHGTDLDNYVAWTKQYVSGGKTATEKDVTKAEIIKGVKTGVITRVDGKELLVDLGYSEDEASYLLAINIPPDEETAAVKERQLTKADILQGLKTGVITRAGAGAKLLELRYSPPDVDFLLRLYDAQVKPPVEPRLKEASKADIVLGVKKGLITQEEGYLMLLDIDFSPEAANFILMVKTEESPFSPMNYAEFKEMTQQWRKATGMEAKPVTEELKAAAAEVVKLTGEVENLRGSLTEEERRLVKDEVLPVEATVSLKKIQVTLHRAEAKLAHAKSEYQRLLAEWKHGG